MTNKEINKLPKHLQDTLSKYHSKCEKFGIDPNWASKAREKAEKTGNDFNPIHGLTG